MADSVCESETASCTAITEKRQDQPTGGCTGILFRLIDWNRRFAKKKLFSRKLLPPAPGSASKKFKGDEKMPSAKLYQIADDNRGFPKLKKNGKSADLVHKHEMRAPCLVARLMGLDLMPAVHRDKAKKSSSAVSAYDRKLAFVAGTTCDCGNGASLPSEDRQMKHNDRPLKLQKTGQSSERRGQVLARFAHEGMQFKGVLSRNKKHHHPKLATPVKSPRASPATHVSRSRLVDAATKILEPGLVAKNKYRHAISYPGDKTHTCLDNVMSVGSRVRPQDMANQSDCDTNTNSATNFAQETACMNCGCLLDKADFRPIGAAKPSHCSASILADTPDQYGANLSQPSVSPHEQVKKMSCMLSQENPVMTGFRLWNDLVEHREVLGHKTPESQKTKEHEGRTHSSIKKLSPIPTKEGTSKPRWLASAEERIPPAKVSGFRKRRMTSVQGSADGVKGFGSFNCRQTAQGHEIVPGVPKGSTTDAHAARISSCAKRTDSSSQLRTPVQKRRFFDVDCRFENRSFAGVSSRHQWSPGCASLTESEQRLGVQYYNDALITRRSRHRAKGSASNHPGMTRATLSSSTSSHMGGTIGCNSDVARSFFNCNSISSHSGDHLGLKTHCDFAGRTCDQLQSNGIGKLNEQDWLPRNKMTNLYARTSKDFCNFGVARASRYKLYYAPMVGMDCEPAFADVHLPSTCRVIDFGVIPPLLNKLEKSASSSLLSITAGAGSDNGNGRKQLRELLLDCLVEFLDSRFYWNEVCCLRKRRPLPVDLDTLIEDVEGEVRSWAGLSATSIDETIEWEIDHSYEKWTDFQNEVLENGIRIDSGIFQSLVEELVEDFQGAFRLKCSF